jgi:hypothetical protein
VGWRLLCRAIAEASSRIFHPWQHGDALTGLHLFSQHDDHRDRRLGGSVSS